MIEYIRLLAAKQVEIEALITDRYPIRKFLRLTLPWKVRKDRY